MPMEKRLCGVWVKICGVVVLVLVVLFATINSSKFIWDLEGAVSY